MKLTQRNINKISRILDNYIMPIVLIFGLIGLLYMAITMLIALHSEEGEIAKIRRESEERFYMPAPTQTYYNVE